MHFITKRHIFLILAYGLCGLGIGGWIAFFSLQIVDLSKIIHIDTAKPSILLDDEGHEWAHFGLDRGKPVNYSAIPSSIINAFLATEDRQFFTHHGISLRGIVRSILVNIWHGKFVQGASTITQQLVKLLFLYNKKTWSRKIKEQWYALIIETMYTKEQILETYLNNVYFGHGIYGIQAASRQFWNTDTTELSLAQSALLAGIVRLPNKYCPLKSPEYALKRRNIILKSMRECVMITQEEFENALNEELELQPSLEPCCAPHLKENLRMQLVQILGDEKILYSGGFIIQTTLNQKMQKSAVEVFTAECTALRTKLQMPIDGALMTIASATGAIKTLVGGYDFKTSQFNRALSTSRQIGSTIKPFVFASALADGLALQEVIEDEPTTFMLDNKAWQPRNYNKKFNGPMTRAWALARSNNIVAIKTLLAGGADKVADLAQKAGFRHKLHTYPSLALGCIDGTLEEIVGMFNIFANNGVFVSPHALVWIKNNAGEKIWHHLPVERVVVSGVIAAQIGIVLQYSFLSVYKQIHQAQVRFKTGTTNDSCTCWGVGSTPEYTTGVYIGCDDNRPMGENVYPIRTTLPIWQKFHATVPAKQLRFYVPSELKRITINKRTGQVVNSSDPDGMEIFV
jgi:membrane carboxypeptidase/penicillin-binding protein